MCKDQLKMQFEEVTSAIDSKSGAKNAFLMGNLNPKEEGGVKSSFKTAGKVARTDAEDLGWLKEKVAPLDPVAEKARIAAQETSASNARIAMQRRAMRENSLFSGGGAGGRSTLGV
jgi:phage repressor protein C with HTH and peptisase S24 domain